LSELTILVKKLDNKITQNSQSCKTTHFQKNYSVAYKECLQKIKKRPFDKNLKNVGKNSVIARKHRYLERAAVGVVISLKAEALQYFFLQNALLGKNLLKK